MHDADVDRVSRRRPRWPRRSQPASARDRIERMSRAVELSVVIPVYNEEAVLPALFARLYPALDALGRSYEIIFVNDGSRDRSAALLREQFEQRPDVTRVVLFAANFGQHRAILAGFAHARGRYVITLDADLQNPPEEIAARARRARRRATTTSAPSASSARTSPGAAGPRASSTRCASAPRSIRMTDQGCMLRGYARSIVDAINQCSEINTFMPALAYTFASSPTEIDVRHEERGAGESKYSLYRLIRLNFDLMTGFSTVPLQLFSVLGIAVSLLSVAVRHRAWWCAAWSCGAEAEQGVFTLFAIAFLLIGVALFGIGLLGEYVGPHLRGGAAPAALHRRRGARASAPDARPAVTARGRASPTTTWACAACACCWRRASTVPLVVTHEDAARRARSGSTASRAMRAGTASRSSRRRTRTTPEFVARVRARAAGLPVLVLLPPHARRRAAGAAAPRGAYNMHGSLLPKYRGRVPVNWAVLHGERETGATLHAMTAKPDAGAIVDAQAVPILPRRHGRRGVPQGHRGRRADAGSARCRRCSPAPRALRRRICRQGSYFGRRTRADGAIDWRAGCAAVHNLVRAVAPPYPGAFALAGGRAAARAAHAAGRRRRRAAHAGAAAGSTARCGRCATTARCGCWNSNSTARCCDAAGVPRALRRRRCRLQTRPDLQNGGDST